MNEYENEEIKIESRISNEKQKKNITVLGQETEFEGDLEFTDTLVISGKFKGSIKATGDLEIDKTGICEFDSVKINSIVISGEVKGNIEAKERVEMCSGSNVLGDVATSRLRISDNVVFDGQVTMMDSVPDVDLFSVASDDFRNAFLSKSDMPH